MPTPRVMSGQGQSLPLLYWSMVLAKGVGLVPIGQGSSLDLGAKVVAGAVEVDGGQQRVRIQHCLLDRGAGLGPGSEVGLRSGQLGSQAVGSIACCVLAGVPIRLGE